MNEAVELLRIAKALSEEPISKNRGLKKVEITYGRKTEVAYKGKRGKYYVLHPSKRYWTTLKLRPGQKIEEKSFRRRDQKDKLPLRASINASDDDNSLDGMTNVRARRNVNAVLRKVTPRGIVRDTAWQHVQVIWKALEGAAFDWAMGKTFYKKDNEGRPSSKTWYIEVYFTNNRGRKTTLHGVVVASGAGTVDDPLDAYDIVAYVS